jgi:hypothetical protein
MRIRDFMIMTATAGACLSLAACGGDDRLSDRELENRLTPIAERISGEFGAVFAELGRAEEVERVPADVRDRLRQAAEAERQASDEAAALEPPERAEKPVDRLVEATRAQADRLEQLAGTNDLTVGQMADAVEDGEVAAALEDLAKGGYVEPPPRHK